MSSPQRKKVLFKDFVRGNESRFTGKYPFLTSKQIQVKLKQSWKKLCQQDNKHKVNGLRGKSENTIPGGRHSQPCTKATSSPQEVLVLLSHDADDSETKRSSDGWYDDNSAENSCPHEPDGMPLTDALTEETVDGVLGHALNIEMNQEKCENTPTKKEKILSELFHPMEKLEKKSCDTKQARLLVSEETEGESNFSGMFDGNDNIFI